MTKILITAAGSYGDIAPYTGVGARLRAAGHEVALATHDTYAPLVRAAGLEFRRLPADPRTHHTHRSEHAEHSGHAEHAGPESPERGTPTGKRALMRRAATFIKELGDGIADAAQQGAGTGTGAELLLLSATTAPLGRHLAEAMDIPALELPLTPNAPTGDFAPIVSGGRSLGRWGNRAAGRLSLRIIDRLYRDAAHELRARLGLPSATPRTVRRRAEAEGRPVLHGFSEVLVPRPGDWPSPLTVVGNWWPWHAPDAELPPVIRDFLAAGPPPVFIGFGSMAANGDGERLSALAVQALRRAKVRGILQSGWAGLTTSPHDGTLATSPTDDILTIGEVPHALLFPHMSAVVHHCGAGTAAAGLRAGVPTVPVPVAADQPFWAARLASLGVASTPVPFKELTEELPPDRAVARLAHALTQATGAPARRDHAAAAARRLAAEDGAGAVVHAVQQALDA
ncbi:putative glycosyltransferase [Streptomyces sp. NBRC 110611]|uniref:glycosyltransferase n=1 Tax=Streptomyces sp. NBRC 110611 TaxID=1621259 RepID=UPI0008309F7C|nr:glycosyltransferase [Streptomyces sp. NBRC 110611]GAU68674.1 putative glycosyltransferase [Streptomyces sp. NBRC 110611]